MSGHRILKLRLKHKGRKKFSPAFDSNHVCIYQLSWCDHLWLVVAHWQTPCTSATKSRWSVLHICCRERKWHTYCIPLLISCVLSQDHMALDGKLCVLSMMWFADRMWTLEDLFRGILKTYYTINYAVIFYRGGGSAVKKMSPCMRLGSTHCRILCIQCTVLRTEIGPIS